jgi:hypothetical protein
MSYKWVYYSDKDAGSQIELLRRKFNTKTKQYYFKDGSYKGKSCIYVLNDLTTKQYAEPLDSKQFKGSLFFPPLESISLEDVEIQKDKREWKIKVDVVSGVTLWIIPATLEPKKIVFDFDDTGAKEEDSPYSLATEYGTLAYSIFDDIEHKKEVTLSDPRVKKLIMLALQKSYNIPIDIINWAGIVSVQDVDPLLSAAMGISPELLEKKSDGSKQ